MSSTTLQAQLRQVYAKYRTAALNRKYYGHKLVTTRRVNLCFELLLALVTSSAIGAWAIWKNEPGAIIWAVLSAGAAVVAVAKPLLRLPDRLERYSKLFVGHADIFLDLQRLVVEIQQSRRFPKHGKDVLEAALDKFQELAPDDDPKPSPRLLRRYYEEVKREIPTSRLWFPPSD